MQQVGEIMKTFIEQKIDLEQENRYLQRQIDDVELAMEQNRRRINELYETLNQVGMPS